MVTGSASPFRYLVGSNYESKDDLREIDFLRQIGDKYYIFKYAGSIRTEDTDGTYTYLLRSTSANWIVYRLPEIMLMKAEALIQLETNNAEALNLINTVYLRSNPELLGVGLSLNNYNTKYDLEKLLLRERQRELMFEGKRWYDLMRLTRRAEKSAPLISYLSQKYTGTASARLTKLADMDALYFPIHNDELKANTKLEQNEFYKLTGEDDDD